MNISKSLEEYIKTMYILKKQKGFIRVTDIAEKMKCTKASVNKAMKILTENGFIDYKTYGKIELNDTGIKVAKKVLEAYDIVYIFLTEMLGMSKSEAQNEAENIKKSMSDITLNKLAKYTQNELGIQDLTCNFDINNEKCIECGRRIKSANVV